MHLKCLKILKPNYAVEGDECSELPVLYRLYM